MDVRRLWAGWIALGTMAAACSDTGSKGAPGGANAGHPPAVQDPGTDYVALKARADAAQALTPDGVAKAYPTSFGSLGYDPTTALYLDRIQASAIALTDGEKQGLAKNGFVVSTGREFPTFVNGYATIYAEHLPVYISADAILDSVHRSYDAILQAMELGTLIDDVWVLLGGMRMRLSTSTAPAPLRADVDVYLAVALGLLQGTTAAPVAGGDFGTVSSVVAKANAAMGPAGVTLFGTMRDEDFSQYEPRGHYADDPRLSQYFRTMMWLGRVDLRLVETKSNGEQIFNREQYDAMLLIRDLIGTDIDRWHRVDDTLRAFIGKSDNMVVPEVDQLVVDLGGADSARAASNEAVLKALVEGGYGKQEIASYLMVNGTAGTLPLNRSFLVFGQRYIVDSHVFSAVVDDRIPGRMMPDPLDVAFGALANNQALALDPDVATNRALPGALARMRTLVDSNDATFWDSSLYNAWLASLRALSPAPDAASTKAGLPKIATTEAWGRRILNAQLGSWAELRHDTLLYAKQSYTSIPACDYPDAYVDPYPEAFAAIRKYAEQGTRIAALATSPDFASTIGGYFEALRNAASILETIAREELQGEALTADQLAFINDAVRVVTQSAGCTSIDVPDGWLANLYYEPIASIKFDPTIADVHTQPADAGGNPVGRILHVGTSYPRLMVATADSCGGGPRAYAGIVFAYHETITQNFSRLTDEGWASQLSGGGARPADVPWMSPVLSH